MDSRTVEKSACLIGIEGAGKSTCAGLILLTALNIANDPDSKASLVVEEKTLPIRTIADALQKGYFPPPTPPGASLEAYVRLKFRRRVMTVSVDIGIVDMAGETLRELLDYAAEGRFEIPSETRIHDVNRFVLNASSFLLVVDLQRLVLLGQGDSQDAQFARFIDLLAQWKRTNKRSPRVKCVGLVLTKYDTVRDLLADQEHISLDSEDDRRDFMNKFMLQTLLTLRDRVSVREIDAFYSGVGLLTDTSGSATRRLRLMPRTRQPVYTVEEYTRLISWLRHALR